MKKETLEKLRSPNDNNKKLILESGNLNNGVLCDGNEKFRINDGIPRLLAKNFDKTTSKIFSIEWKELKASDDPWGLPISERLSDLGYLKMPSEKLKGLDFLDAGCGNGLFARAVAAKYHMNVIGMDISKGLELANSLKHQDETIDFLQADAQYPPLARETFDIIWCFGSLHHTPDPKFTFLQLAPLLRIGGRIFVLLYAKPEKWTYRLIMRRLTKTIVCRLPIFLQDLAVFLIACFTLFKSFILYKILGKKLSYPYVPKLRHHLMGARDSFTVRYDWQLTCEDVAEWHKESGLRSIYVSYVKLYDARWLVALAENLDSFRLK